jgi:hypothetical protein
MTELRDEMFIGAAEKAVPGRNRWVANICRRAKFRPRSVRYGESLAETLSPIVSEHAVALVPDRKGADSRPRVTVRPIVDRSTWDFLADTAALPADLRSWLRSRSEQRRKRGESRLVR